MSIDLEDFKNQREYRQNKRKQLLVRYQAIQGSIPLPISPHPEPTSSNEYQDLLTANAKYRQQLHTLNQQGTQYILQLKQQLTIQKNHYKKELSQLIELSEQQKMNKKQKIEEMFRQIKDTITKNKELRANNLEIEQFLLGDPSSQIEEIQREYLRKEEELGVKLEESNKMVGEFESQFYDEKVIDKALENEELIQAMIQEGEQEFKEVLLTEEYVAEVVRQKNEILSLLMENRKGKELELQKMDELGKAYKQSHTKINEERNILVESNTKIATQLLKIKEIFKQILIDQQNQGGSEGGDQEIQEDIEDEDGGQGDM